MSEVIKLLDSSSLEHIVVHTGQHFDKMLSGVFFDGMDIRKPDFNLSSGGGNHVEQSVKRDIGLYNLCNKQGWKPEDTSFLFLGDSNSVLSSIFLKKEGYGIIHIEAGQRSYDDRMLEEQNRRCIDLVSDIAFCYHKDYIDILSKEGFRGVSYDVGNTIVEPTKRWADLNYIGKKDYILVDIHRPENFKYPNRMLNILDFCRKLSKMFSVEIRMLEFKRTYEYIKSNNISIYGINKIELMGYKEFLKAQQDALIVCSDCLHPDSLITLENGDIKKISDIHKNDVIISNGTNNKVLNKFSKNVEKKYRIETTHGVIKCSSNHILVSDGREILASDLKVKDTITQCCKLDCKTEYQKLETFKIDKFFYLDEKLKQELMSIKKGVIKELGRVKQLIKKNQRCRESFLEKISERYGIPFRKNIIENDGPKQRVKFIKQPNILNEELAELIGMISGDGSNSLNQSRIHDDNIVNLERMMKLYKSIFDLDGIIISDKRTNGKSLLVSSKYLIKFLEINFLPEISKVNDSTRDISKKICMSPDSVVSSFLKGLYSAEGYVGDHSIGIAMSDEFVIRKVGQLLLRFGIINKYYRDEPRREKDKSVMHKIIISERESMELFLEKIGFICDSQNNKIRNIFSRYVENPRNQNRSNGLFEAKINKIQEIYDDNEYIDISVSGNNLFFVDGILSHNSGTAQEETPLLGTPVIVPRDYTERPQSVKNNCSIHIDVNNNNNKYFNETEWLKDFIEKFEKRDLSWLGDGKTSSSIVSVLDT